MFIGDVMKKLHKKLIFTFIFLILSISCFSWVFYINKVTNTDEVTLHEFISNNKTKEKQKVNLTVSEIPYLFAEIENGNNKTGPKYYFLMDRDYLYIGYLDHSTYMKLNNKSINDNPIKITGITKKIPDDIVEIAINVYNENLGYEFLNKDNYHEYIGTICIDTVSDLVNSSFIFILGFICMLVSFINIFSYFYKMNLIKSFK